MFEFEMAQKFCQRALELEPDNVQALETCGTLLLELGELESAKHVSCQHWLSLRGDLKNDQCTTLHKTYIILTYDPSLSINSTLKRTCIYFCVYVLNRQPFGR